MKGGVSQPDEGNIEFLQVRWGDLYEKIGLYYLRARYYDPSMGGL